MILVDKMMAITEQDLSLRKKIISLLDFTCLDDNATTEIMAEFCRKAITPLGTVAAVCIPAHFVALTKRQLAAISIAVATIANFPAASHSIKTIEEQINFAINEGADEVDVVLPYQLYLNDQRTQAQTMLQKIRDVCTVKLKIILEIGALKTAELIAQATQDVIQVAADFVKTSTGKIPVGATLAAANIILTTLKQNSATDKKIIGFKASGGITNVAQAKDYLALAENIMGQQWINNSTFRFGASSLLDDVLMNTQNGSLTY